MKHDGDTRFNQGFTLVELVMTIVLVGLLATVAVPKMFDFKAYQQRAFYDEMVNAIRYAQKLAIASSCNVQFLVSANQYRLRLPDTRTNCSSTTAASFTRDIARPGSGETSFTGSLSGMILSDATVYFQAKGNASANVIITIGSGQITVVQDTGFVYGTAP